MRTAAVLGEIQEVEEFLGAAPGTLEGVDCRSAVLLGDEGELVHFGAAFSYTLASMAESRVIVHNALGNLTSVGGKGLQQA